MMMQTSIAAVAAAEKSEETTRWFFGDGCVEYGVECAKVYVGGTLVGTFCPGEELSRDLLLVSLSKDRHIQKQKLAWAFSLKVNQVWKIRCLEKAGGLEALIDRPCRGRKRALTAELFGKIFKAFDAGKSVKDILAASKGLHEGISERSIFRVRQDWLYAQQQPVSEAPAARGKASQLEITAVTQPAEAPSDVPAAVPCDAPASGVLDSNDRPGDGGLEQVDDTPVHGGAHVQHVGGWLLVAMVHALGLHAAVQQGWDAVGRWGPRLRMALDAVVLALGLGQRCVEGVRRLQTPSAGVLLRAAGAPTANWTRRILKVYLKADGSSEAGDGSAAGRGHKVQMRMMELYLAQAHRAGKAPAVFYVDNHMRAYTGKYTLRKGWRMQDKRARPGASDYYVHDEDGRPVFRYTAPEHDSLSRWLTPVTQRLREALGAQQRILLAFDRAGAFPETMAKLRDRGFEFVTYERRPYPTVPKAWFTDKLVIGDSDSGGGGGEVIGVYEHRRKNLNKGRGRVRRISLLMQDGHQINLLAISDEPVACLVEVMLGRWVQENAFKHGNERWGINQLDGRKTEPYPPQTIIPNPARRRLDHAMKLARVAEGRARNKLARLCADDPRRDKYQKELDEALRDQDIYLMFRVFAPVKVSLKDSELAGKLVKHDPNYKALIDTIRIACANAESELALMLAPHLPQPREAKKTLANLFASPGAVRVNHTSVTVSLQPAGTNSEQLAFSALFDQVNRLNLSLPGDPEARQLRFRLLL